MKCQFSKAKLSILETIEDHGAAVTSVNEGERTMTNETLKQPQPTFLCEQQTGFVNNFTRQNLFLPLPPKRAQFCIILARLISELSRTILVTKTLKYFQESYLGFQNARLWAIRLITCFHRNFVPRPFQKGAIERNNRILKQLQQSDKDIYQSRDTPPRKACHAIEVFSFSQAVRKFLGLPYFESLHCNDNSTGGDNVHWVSN